MGYGTQFYTPNSHYLKSMYLATKTQGSTRRKWTLRLFTLAYLSLPIMGLPTLAYARGVERHYPADSPTDSATQVAADALLTPPGDSLQPIPIATPDSFFPLPAGPALPLPTLERYGAERCTPYFTPHPGLWAIPTGLVTIGVVSLNQLGWWDINPRVQEAWGVGPQSLPYIDDVGQYLPLATATTMRMCGVRGGTNSRLHYLESTAIGASLMASVVLGTKALGLQLRPDGSRWNSFMSGHSATAFFGAEILRIEYGRDYPYLAFMGYMVAVTTGALRIHHQRHWVGDVLAGAGVGIGTAWAGYLLQPYLDQLLQRVIPSYRDYCHKHPW